MGNFLDKPETSKQSGKDFGGDLAYGFCSMQGWRDKMEDSTCINNNLRHGSENWSFFAVFDGHGGDLVSSYCSEHILEAIVQTDEFQLPSAPDNEIQNIKACLYKGFLQVEQQMMNIQDYYESKSGTTAICVLISTSQLYIANCGDSRAVLWKNAALGFCTEDHKPNNPIEEQRIRRAGGIVRNQRVNGSLAVSRALGDFRFKRLCDTHPYEQIVSAEPEISVISRDDGLDEFLVIACDGIWDVMEIDNLCHNIHNMLLITTDVEFICTSVVDACLHKGSKDNMSIIVVVLPGAPHVCERAVLEDLELNRILEQKLIEILRNEENDPVTMQEIIDTISSDESCVIPRENLWFKCTLLQDITEKLRRDNPQPNV